MHKLKIITAGSAGIWLFAVAMVIIFPRHQYPTVSTVFAILFWLSLFVTGFLTYLLVTGIRKQKKRKQKKRFSSSSDSPIKTDHSENITLDKHTTKHRSPEVKK